MKLFWLRAAALFLFQHFVRAGWEIRHIRVEPFLVDFLEFARFFQFCHGVVDLFQQFFVVFVDGKGQVFRLRIGDIDDIELSFAVLGQEVIGNRFVEDSCRRAADLEFHNGFGVVIELFNCIALFFSVFSPCRADLDGNLLALQVGYRMDTAVFRR